MLGDIRVNSSVRTVFGPHLCGDSALDVRNNEILTGSWRYDKQLQVWDIGSGQEIKDIPMCRNPGLKSSMLYAAQFSKSDSEGRFIAAGGSNPHEISIFDSKNNYTQIGSVANLPNGVFSVDFSPSRSCLAAAGGLGPVVFIDVNPETLAI